MKFSTFIKRQLLALCLLFAFSSPAISQERTIYGSYILDQEVYKYQFSESRNGYSLQLSKLEDTYLFPKFDTAKLNRTLNQIELNKDSSSVLPQYKEMVEELRQLTELYPKWNGSKKRFKEVMDKMSIDSFRKEMDKTIAVGGDNDIYQIAQITNPYHDFIKRMNEPSQSETRIFPEMKVGEFKNAFRKAMIEMDPEISALDNLASSVGAKGEQLFYEILTRLKFTESEPITAYAILKRKTIEVRSDNATKDTISCEVSKMHIEFEDGAMKNILVELIPLDARYTHKYGKQPLIFRNNMPISVSGKFDPERFSRYLIFLGNSKELRDAIGNKDFKDVYFVLSELLDYNQVLSSNKEDYSPVNQVIELSQINLVQELKKEKASMLFDARAYTDVVGFSDDNPNGLIQVELSRKINLFTTRMQRVCLLPFELNKKYKIRRNIRKWNSPYNYTGFMTNFEVRAAYNKIEENNRYYVVNGEQLDSQRSIGNFDTRFNVNPLDVMRYRKWTIGTDLNIYKLTLTECKMSVLVNGYFCYGHTQLADSLGFNRSDTTIVATVYQNVSGLNWISYGIGLAAEFKPDSRYNFQFHYDWRWIDIYHPRHNLDERVGNQFHVAGFSGFRKLSDVSEIFFRYNRFWQHGNPRNNFDQIQLGYQLDLFTGAKSGGSN